MMTKQRTIQNTVMSWQHLTANTANNRLAQTTNSRLKNDGSEKRIRT